MSDHDKLTDEQLTGFVEWAKLGVGLMGAVHPWVDVPELVAELRALRKLRDEVEPVLRSYLSDHDTDIRNRINCRCSACDRNRDILARHFGGTQ